MRFAGAKERNDLNMANMKKEYKMSAERKEELQKELTYLKTVREKEVADLIKEARGFGDLSENSEYDEAKNEQGKLYSRIAEVEEILLHTVIVDENDDGSNGIGGFITFLIAEVLAQVVNYFVQMKWVFKSEHGYGESAWKYAVLAVFIVVVNLMLPGYVTDFCTDTFGVGPALASNIASVVNTLLAVVVSFPILKFWIAE